MIYRTLEDAIEGTEEFANAFDMGGFVKITSAPEGSYELFGTGRIVLVVLCILTRPSHYNNFSSV